MVPGLIYMFGGTVAPYGFLMCDGSAVSRSTYSDLFDTIGTTYGPGDGATTFNIPDLTGRIPIGISGNVVLGDTGGEEMHTLTTTELPSHGHTIPAHGHANTITATTPKLTHSITQPMFTYNPPSGGQSAQKYSTTSNDVTTANTSTAATRSANLAIAKHSASACTKTGSVTDCSAFNTSSAGSDSAHSNMQPYLTLNYVISTGL